MDIPTRTNVIHQLYLTSLEQAQDPAFRFATNVDNSLSFDELRSSISPELEKAVGMDIEAEIGTLKPISLPEKVYMAKAIENRKLQLISTDYCYAASTRNFWMKAQELGVVTQNNRPPYNLGSVGINCMVRTYDNKMLLSLRSDKVAIYKDSLHSSVGEGSNSKDLDESGNLDFIKTVVRGFKEELHLDVAAEDIRTLGLMMDDNISGFGLLSYVDLERQEVTSKDLIRLHTQAEDSWEGELKFIDFRFKALMELKDERWGDGGWINAVLALMYAYDHKIASTEDSRVLVAPFGNTTVSFSNWE